MQVAGDMNLQGSDDLLAGIGAGKISPKQVVTKLIKILAKESAVQLSPRFPCRSSTRRGRCAPERATRASGCAVIDDVLVRLAHCCNPVPGDRIVGFVTRAPACRSIGRLSQRPRARRADPRAD